MALAVCKTGEMWFMTPLTLPTEGLTRDTVLKYLVPRAKEGRRACVVVNSTISEASPNMHNRTAEWSV